MPARAAPTICVIELEKQYFFQVVHKLVPSLRTWRTAAKNDETTNCDNASTPSTEIRCWVLVGLKFDPAELWMKMRTRYVAAVAMTLFETLTGIINLPQ